MKTLLKTALCSTALISAGVTLADDEQTDKVVQLIRSAGSQAFVKGPEQVFSGAARIEPLFPATDEINASAAYVTFEPGARSAWHSHPQGQHIIVTYGVGFTQQWGEPIQTIKPGDVIWCPPGVKHWHGASATTPLTHIVVTGHDKAGNNVNWMEKVSDAQYRGQL